MWSSIQQEIFAAVELSLSRQTNNPPDVTKFIQLRQWKLRYGASKRWRSIMGSVGSICNNAALISTILQSRRFHNLMDMEPPVTSESKHLSRVQNMMWASQEQRRGTFVECSTLPFSVTTYPLGDQGADPSLHWFRGKVHSGRVVSSSQAWPGHYHCLYKWDKWAIKASVLDDLGWKTVRQLYCRRNPEHPE